MAENEEQELGTVAANELQGLPSIPSGMSAQDPEAQQAMNQALKLRGMDYARAGIGGASAGISASQGSANPLAAMIQGISAGMQIPAQIYKEKQAQIKTTLDATPFGEIVPEAKDPNSPYSILAGIPYGLAAKAIQGIAQEAVKSQLAPKEVKTDNIIRTEAEAMPYVKLLKNSGIDIAPADIIGMRREDVDNYQQKGTTQPEVDLQTSEIMEKAPAELATQYGLPVQRKNPYYNMPAKVYEKVRTAQSINATKTIEKMAESASAMDNVINSLARAKSLLDSKAVNTGPIRQAFRMKATQSAEAQEFEQIASTILPSMRSGMPGAVSDRDMAIFKEANFGLNKDEAVNKKVIDQHLAIANRVKDKANFMADWGSVYGDMSGAEAAWGKYIKEVPLFTLQGSINPNVTTYQQFFNSKDSAEMQSVQKRKDEIKARLSQLQGGK